MPPCTVSFEPGVVVRILPWLVKLRRCVAVMSPALVRMEAGLLNWTPPMFRLEPSRVRVALGIHE